METDIFSLFLPDFFCNCVIAALLGSVKNSEAHFVSAARSLRKYAVLMFLALCKLCVMLCHPRKDIDAFSAAVPGTAGQTKQRAAPERQHTMPK